MFSLVRLIIWALPLVGLIKARQESAESRTFTPGGAARDLREISRSMEEYATTLSGDRARDLRAIARNLEEVRADVIAWGEKATGKRGSWLGRLFGGR